MWTICRSMSARSKFAFAVMYSATVGVTGFCRRICFISSISSPLVAPSMTTVSMSARRRKSRIQLVPSVIGLQPRHSTRIFPSHVRTAMLIATVGFCFPNLIPTVSPPVSSGSSSSRRLSHWSAVIADLRLYLYQ